jgi:hypothetical protein
MVEIVASGTRQQIIERSECRVRASKVFRESNNNDLANVRKYDIKLMFDKFMDKFMDRNQWY